MAGGEGREVLKNWAVRDPVTQAFVSLSQSRAPRDAIGHRSSERGSEGRPELLKRQSWTEADRPKGQAVEAVGVPGGGGGGSQGRWGQKEPLWRAPSPGCRPGVTRGGDIG